MKCKIILYALFALLTFGCTETERMEEQVKKPITFDASVGKQTRYIVDGEVYPEDLNFGIWAFLKAQGEADYNYDTPFMYDTEIEKFDYGWVTKEDYYYWPVYGKLKFVAYSPYDIGTPTYSATEGLKFTDVSPYEGDAHSFQDVDFMYTEDASATDKTISDAPVGLLFKHALAQVRFTAMTTQTDAVFTIKELKIGEIKDVGTFQTLPTPQWGDLKSSDEQLNWFAMFEGSKTIGSTEEQVGFSLLYIPQPVAGMRVKIKYDVTYNGVTESVNKTFALSGSPWEMNQKIKYALNLSINEITFTPTINDWTSATEVPVLYNRETKTRVRVE